MANKKKDFLYLLNIHDQTYHVYFIGLLKVHYLVHEKTTFSHVHLGVNWME